MRHSVFLAAILFLSCVHAEDTLLETKVKAAYLYNFTKFINWPDQTGKALQICVAGENSIHKLLEDLALKQKEKEVFILVPNSKIQTSACQILYLSPSDDRFDALMKAAKEKDILTVSDHPRFAEYGGIITLFSDNGKIRFTVNLSASRKTNLKISSKLIELSKTSR